MCRSIRRSEIPAALRRATVLAFAFLSLLAPAASAQSDGADAPPPTEEATSEPAPFSALRVLPAGRQVFDLASGETVLPDGGTVLTAEGGIRLEAPRIRYLEGRYLEADDGVLRGDFGTVRGAAIRYDLEAGTIRVEDGVQLERSPLRLDAAALSYDTGSRLARIAGPVRGSDPDFEAAAVLLDAADGTALLLGPYSYRDGLFTLESPNEEGLLELRPTEIGDALVYDASSRVDPATLDRFAALLP